MSVYCSYRDVIMKLFIILIGFSQPMPPADNPTASSSVPLATLGLLPYWGNRECSRSQLLSGMRPTLLQREHTTSPLLALLLSSSRVSSTLNIKASTLGYLWQDVNFPFTLEMDVCETSVRVWWGIFEFPPIKVSHWWLPSTYSAHCHIYRARPLLLV